LDAVRTLWFEQDPKFLKLLALFTDLLERHHSEWLPARGSRGSSVRFERITFAV